MTGLVVARRFMADYARTGANLLVLVLVPVVFVVVAAPSLADAARVLGGAGSTLQVETVTAGWAAGFLAGIAMYFQAATATASDRRLVIAGLAPATAVAARLLVGAALALLAAAAALLALVSRGVPEHLPRVVAGTVMYAVIYLSVGAVAGAFVRNQVNGVVLVMFVWLLDVFFGPALSASTVSYTRALPTHFVSLWMADLPSRHGGRLGDLGWALLWTGGSALVAAWALARSVRRAGRSEGRTPGSGRDQLLGATAGAVRDWRRNPVLWVLLAVVPAVYILLADAITPHGAEPVMLTEHGRSRLTIVDPATMHAGTMAPIAVASLATLAGLFAAVESGRADRRLSLAGMRPATVVAARLLLVALAAVTAAVVSLAVTATVFTPQQWPVYAGSVLLIALTYALLGVLLGQVVGKVSGVFIAFLIPFLDVGIAQSPMLRAQPPPWGSYLPSYGASRALIDGALTPAFDTWAQLALGLLWLTAALAAAYAILRRRVT